MGAADDDRYTEVFLDPRRNLQRLPIIRREQRGDADDFGL